MADFDLSIQGWRIGHDWSLQAGSYPLSSRIANSMCAKFMKKTKEDGGYGKRKDNVDENDEGLGGYRQRVQERIGDRRPATSPEDKHFLDAPLGWALEIFLSALPSVTPITACSAIADLILTELEVLSISPAAVSVVAAVTPVAQLGESRVLSRQGAVLAAPKSLSSKLVVNRSRVVMSAAPQKDQNMAGLTSVALLAAAIIPEIAEAAQPGISPSLKNLLLSVVAGGVVLSAIGVAVAGVSTFDPVKRR
ncbi:hypothetical protein AXG93_1433s1110 [Marchantia polymorpha subsp. ruderalis]|uniref:Uncharacterized protein n=1 Tax=Marchantia polymorpha subsp. ruderalis TaxID=1480154 RepID=A0A176W9Y2_MARPO|nr:hypothetical protein AXG93_1433s1110 [Marchantia polymorpha subsp. ruderalis]